MTGTKTPILSFFTVLVLTPLATFAFGTAALAAAVAGAIKASQNYSSGLSLAVYDSGAGRFILNTLLIRENLGANPVAERLLRNLLNYAATESKAASLRSDGGVTP